MKKHVSFLAALAMTVTGAQAAEIGMNFGEASSATNWNNITWPDIDIGNLTYLDGSSSGYSLITDDETSFGLVNIQGTTSPAAPASNYFPASVTRTSLYGNTATFSGRSDPLACLSLSGLDTDAT